MGRQADDRELACRALEYWELLDFFEQEAFPSFSVPRGAGQGHIDVVAQVNPGQKLVEAVETWVKARIGRSAESYVWPGTASVFIGSVKRSDVTNYLALSCKLDPEAHESLMAVIDSDSASIALAKVDVCLTTGEYQKGTFELSPVVWACSRIGASDTASAADLLREKDYDQACEQLEADAAKRFAGGVDCASLEDVMRVCKQRYLRPLGFGRGVAIAGEVKTVFAVDVRLFKNSDDAAKYRNPKHLARRFYAEDLAWVAQKLKDGAENQMLGQALVDYVGAPHAEWLTHEHPELAPERLDVLDCSGTRIEDMARLFGSILNPSTAPLGKWPSRWPSALMQEVAVDVMHHEASGVASGTETAQLPNLDRIAQSWLPGGGSAAPRRIFSVNGPPGTGKTTMLKDVIADCIVEKARVLCRVSQNCSPHTLPNPDDAFEKRFFEDGNHKQGGYSNFYYSYFALKDEFDSLNDYSILVCSSNNTAVENITKELPNSGKLQDGLKVSDKDSVLTKEGLKAISKCFDAHASGETLTLFHFEDGKWRRDSYPDLYLTESAKELLAGSSEPKDLQNAEDAWGLVAAPLGKGPNIGSFRNHVLMPLLKGVYKSNDDIGDYRKKFGPSCDRFREQLQQVEWLRSELGRPVDKSMDVSDELNRLRASLERRREEKRALEKRRSELIPKKGKAEDEFVDKVCLYRDGEHALRKDEDAVRESLRYFKDLEKHAGSGLFASLRHKPEYTFVREHGSLRDELVELRQSVQELDARIDQLAAEMAHDEVLIRCHEAKFPGALKPESRLAQDLAKGGADKKAAHLRSPRYDEAYNREREKLFACAFDVLRNFVLGSMCCRSNLWNLFAMWGGKLPIAPGLEDTVDYSPEDKDAAMPHLLQTLFLLVPVISSTFASVSRMFEYARVPGLVGTLIVDEAGQACPYQAVGALARSRRALIVGDPLQIAPVVNDDLRAIRAVLCRKDSDMLAYDNPLNSVQRSADYVNPLGTWLTEDNWLGSPLLVHRRCISPMFDISNAVSYEGTMMNEARSPKPELERKLCRPMSVWINVKGPERGNKNHFVDAQGDCAMSLLREAFGKCEGDEQPSLYVITPFASVRDTFKKHAKDAAHRNPVVDATGREVKDFEAWIKDCIGTVHAFQGKEANEVIFLLGCDAMARGAAEWVKPNIVNVAATRAKYRLYVIGDIDVYERNESVRTMKAFLDTQWWDPENGISSDVRKLPAVEAFPVEDLPDEDDEPSAVGASSATLSQTVDFRSFFQAIDERHISLELAPEHYRMFGFTDEHDFEKRFPASSMGESLTQRHLRAAMRLCIAYGLVADTEDKLSEDSEVSFVAAMLCKSLEAYYREECLGYLKTLMPTYEVNANKPLEKADPSNLTLGSYQAIFRRQRATIGTPASSLCPECDERWWLDYARLVGKAKDARNKACHTDPVRPSDVRELCGLLFRPSDVADGVHKGLLLERRVPELLEELAKGGEPLPERAPSVDVGMPTKEAVQPLAGCNAIKPLMEAVGASDAAIGRASASLSDDSKSLSITVLLNRMIEDGLLNAEKMPKGPRRATEANKILGHAGLLAQQEYKGKLPWVPSEEGLRKGLVLHEPTPDEDYLCALYTPAAKEAVLEELKNEGWG